MTNKVSIEIGYTKSGNLSEDYKYWSKRYLVGTDVKITDGSGNKIEIGSREKGSLITVNGKVIKEMD